MLGGERKIRDNGEKAECFSEKVTMKFILITEIILNKRGF